MYKRILLIALPITMKTLSYIAVFSFLLFLGCDENSKPDPVTPCIQQKIDEFKQDSSAEAIIKILRPEGDLFWFVDDEAVGFELVSDSNCGFVCVTECNCVSEHGCDPLIFSYPREVICEK